MEQILHTLFGVLLLFLVGLAVVSGVAILVLIELSWIVRLGARLYWRLRFSTHRTEVGASNSAQVGSAQAAPRTDNGPATHPRSTPLPNLGTAADNDGGGSRSPCNKTE